MKESIYAAIRGEYGKRVLPPVGTAYDEDHSVIICPVCKHKTLDNYDICRHCGIYTFFPSHIPGEYGGVPDADIIQGTIECDSNENANRCLQAIESLIENGYGKTLNWLIALDMGDIMTYIFNGESMKFLHQGIDALQTSDLAKHLAEAKTVFAYFELSNNCKSTAYYESVLEEISSITNASVWSQVCYHSKDICNVHLWYR